MKSVKVGIIGLGPRGLSILERIVANERVSKSANFELYLFDPGVPGVGCHDVDQADYLLVNTVAAQITQFSDASVKNAGPVLEGPSFYQWLQQQQRFEQLDQEIDVSPEKYYSRALFGKYLNWVYEYLLELAPRHVKTYTIKAEVKSASIGTTGDWLLHTDDTKFRVQYLYLTTGHTKPKDPTSFDPKTITDPYPVGQKLAAIGPNMSIGIEGMGLTSCDVIAELTVGRGGKFEESAKTSRLTYLPSGNEPRICAFSRSGLPLSARAKNQKGVSGQLRPKFLHLSLMHEMREARKLDFQTDIFPLLLADMEYAYYEAYLRATSDPVRTLLFCQQFTTGTLEQRKDLVEREIPKRHHFSWEKMWSPISKAALASREEFAGWLNEYLLEDVKAACAGNVDGPLKAASDVLRDLRDNLRAAIDFAGLTEHSHRWLFSEFLPVMNRLAVGPPVSRIQEMVALIDAGILKVDFGPGAYCVQPTDSQSKRIVSKLWPEHSRAIDVLIQARVPMHSPENDASALMQGLLRDGYVRLFRNSGFHPGGIEIDRNFNWIASDGRVLKNAWALGLPTEGVKFYTFVVPRPGVNSTAVVDAGRAVGKMLDLIKRPASTLSPT